MLAWLMAMEARFSIRQVFFGNTMKTAVPPGVPYTAPAPAMIVTETAATVAVSAMTAAAVGSAHVR